MPGQPPGNIVRIYWGSKRGYLLTRRQDLGIRAAIDLASGDFDRDGASDLAILSADGKIHLVWAVKSQVLSVEFQRGQIELPGDGVQCITAKDMDGDGAADLVIGTHGSGEVYLVGARVPREWGDVTSHKGFSASHVAVGDLDGDQKPELVLTDFDIGHAAGGEAGAAHESETSVNILLERFRLVGIHGTEHSACQRHGDRRF